MTATYLHLVSELLYKIEWPSVRRLRIGISCTYWHFVCALPYSVIESTQSPWDSGSRIDSWVSFKTFKVARLDNNKKCA